MVFEFNLTTKNVYKFLVQRAYSGSHGKMTLLGGGLLIVLSLVILAQGEAEAIYPILFLILGIVLPCSTPVNIYMQAKASVNNEYPEKYEISDDGIVYTHLGRSMNIPWKRIGSVVEYPEGILIDLKANQITLIPKSCVPEQYDQIKQLISQYVNISWKSGKMIEKGNALQSRMNNMTKF